MQDQKPKIDFIDWLLFFPYIFSFFGILVFYDLLQRVTLPFSRNLHEKVIILLNQSLTQSLKLVGTNIEVINHTEWSPGKPYIIISNHQSLFDIPILHTIFATLRPRFVAKKELSRWIPSVSFNLRHGLNAVIDRSNPRQAIKAIKELGVNMNERAFASVIFPEGTRAKTGTLKEFRYAGLASLLDTVPEAQIIPVTLEGSWKLGTRKFGPIPRGIKIKVHIGTPLDREKFPETKLILDEAHKIIKETLETLKK